MKMNVQFVQLFLDILTNFLDISENFIVYINYLEHWEFFDE
jgi:hypothetical protein